MFCLIGLNRPAKRNAFDNQMLAELAAAYARLEDSEDFAAEFCLHTAKCLRRDWILANVAPTVVDSKGVLTFDENAIDPLKYLQ